jgi:uncharacterized protein (DUF1778 family)
MASWQRGNETKMPPDAHDAALRAIEVHSLLRVSAEDQRCFAEALIHPPKPNPALQQAKRLHLETVEVR